jgi:hypothetical protein
MIPVFLLKFVVGLLGPKFSKFAAPLIYAAALLFAVGGFFGLKALYDHSVIKSHDAKQDAANSKADRKADTKAADQRRVDDARVTTETQEVNNAISQAKRSGADPRAAYYECVRLQQSARAAKRVVPTCG